MRDNRFSYTTIEDAASEARAREVLAGLRRFRWLPRRVRGGRHPVASILDERSLGHSVGAILSCPGSGTGLASHIAHRIVELAAARGQAPAPIQTNLHAINWAALVREIGRRLAAAANLNTMYVTPIHFDDGAIVCSIGAQPEAIVFGIPWFGFGQDTVFSAHLPPDPALGYWLLARGYRFIHATREPLDVIHSVLAKLENIEHRGLSADTDPIRELVVNIAYRIGAIADFRRSGFSCHEFRYEKLLSAPVQTIKELSVYLGFGMTPDDAQRIWNNAAFRQLEGAPPAHFQGGGRGKGAKLLGDAWRAILEEQGLEVWLDPGASMEEKHQAAASAISRLRASDPNFSLIALCNFRVAAARQGWQLKDGGIDREPSGPLPESVPVEYLHYAWKNLGPCSIRPAGKLVVAAREAAFADAIEAALAKLARFLMSGRPSARIGQASSWP